MCDTDENKLVCRLPPFRGGEREHCIFELVVVGRDLSFSFSYSIVIIAKLVCCCSEHACFKFNYYLLFTKILTLSW
jgi:hypothetical protein